MPTRIDFNQLEYAAARLIAAGEPRSAIRVYLYMSDGDNSLDGGYLGEKLGECYEALGELDAARYWFGRAIEENPEVRTVAIEARKRLGPIDVSKLLE